MRNSLAPRVQIELFREGSDIPAVIGTDYVVTIDGRWSQDTAMAVVESVAVQAAASRGMEWRRSVYLLGSRYRSVTI
jgi:hypothetical protein